MSAKGRPRKIEDKTRTYNMLYPIPLLDRIHAAAAEDKVSSPEYVRQALDYCLRETVEMVHKASTDGAPPVEIAGIRDPITQATVDQGYNEGVMDACRKIRHSARLGMAMATGQTMGELIATEIEKDLTS